MASTRPVALSPFQREKLEYYFKFLDPDENGHLEKKSIDRLMTRILDFTGWDEDDVTAKEFREVHDAFFEILFERAREEEEGADKVSLGDWFSMWSHMLPGVMAISNLPVWLRLMPKLLFQTIDRHRHGYITARDLEQFYKEMVHLPPDKAQETAIDGYNQMTDHGRYPLNLGSYEQLFANFLIGQTPYGPGRFIFGCFEHEVQPFQLIRPPPDEDELIMEISARPDAVRRPSRPRLSFST